MERQIQIAVARADLIICQARASPLWALAGGLILGALFMWAVIQLTRRCLK